MNDLHPLWWLTAGIIFGLALVNIVNQIMHLQGWSLFR